jgi:DUF4097 and DUF4098 domain-containing protein YvlB
MHSSTSRLLVLLALAVLLAAPALAGPPQAGVHARPAAQRDRDRDRASQVERFTRTLKLGPTGQLVVGNLAGDITVTAGGADTVTIDVVKTARGGSDADAQEQLKLVEVEISERAGRGEVRTRYPQTERHIGNVSVSYTITVPAGTSVEARSVSGDVRVTGIKGAVDAESVSGEVEIRQAERVETAKSISGDVDIDGVSFDGTFEASSVSGDVRARNVKARRIDLGSVSGNVEVGEVSCQTADLKSTSGDVTYTGAFQKSGRYEFRSHSGTVRVTLTGDVGFELEASTFSGSIDSDLPITIGGAGRPAERGSHRSIRGVYGDGSATLDVTTFSGNVIIRKR